MIAPRLVAILLVLAAGSPAFAQERPFLFTISTGGSEARGASVHVDVGASDRSFVFDGGHAIEQRLGLQAALGGGVTVLASAAVAHGGALQAGHGAGSAEALIDVLRGSGRRFRFALGGGVVHEYLGTNAARLRVALGRDFASSKLHGNLVFENPVGAPGRDAIDLLTSVGWMRSMTRVISVGIEAIGEDLEGFWDPEEAEGGARLMIGPSVHLSGASRKWRLTLGGGPVFHPTSSPRGTSASRQLPADPAARTGYVMQSSFSVVF